MPCATCGGTRGAIIDFEGGTFDRSPVWGPCPACNPDGRLLPQNRGTAMSDYAPDEIEHARAMLSCPYYRGDGICDSGCVTEPACQTCEPTEGWAAIAAALPHVAPPSEGHNEDRH